MSLDAMSLNHFWLDLNPSREEGSFDDLELEEILKQPMSALPLGPNEHGGSSDDDLSSVDIGEGREELIARIQKQVCNIKLLQSPAEIS